VPRQPDIDLGTIGFGLDANTEPLERSLAVLQKFGQRVDALAKKTDEKAEAMYRKFAQVERTLLSLFDKTSAASQRLGQTGTGTGKIDELNAAYERLTRTLTKVKNISVMEPHEMARAQVGMNAIINQSQRLAREQEMGARRATDQQQALFRAQQRTADMAAAFQIRGAPAEFTTRATAALNTFESTLKRGTLSTQNLRVAQNALNAELSLLSRNMRVMEGASVMANAFHNLSRATILAVGPLSGVGARMAVLASLFESTTAQAALFVAGVVGVATVVGLIGAAGVRATMEMERFNALLLSASGSSALVGDEFKYVLGQADKLGQNVKGLVAPYASFATAARLSGFALEEQRDIFESVMITGAALRWDADKTGRAFLALEQMIGKSVVQSQEMKLQLGQVIPDAVGLAAIAMGKTTSELMRMMEAGELITKDFLPKFSTILRQTFSPGSVAGAASLQAEFQRLGTAVFLFNKAFDETTRISTAVRAVVVSLADTMRYFADNMNQILAVVAAFGGALASWVVIGTVTTIVMSLRTALIGLWGALLGVGAALSFTGIGALLQALLRIGLMVGGATIAYKAFRTEIDLVSTDTRAFIDNTNQWIKTTEELGFAHVRTAKIVKDATNERLENISREIQGLQLQLEVQKLIEEYNQRTRVQSLGGEPFMQRNLFGRRGAAAATAPTVAAEDPETKALQARIDALRKLQEELATTLEAVNRVKTKDFGLQGELGNKAFDNWIEKVQKAIRENEKLANVLKATVVDQDAVRLAVAMDKAGDLMAELPKKAGNLSKIRAELTAAGFAGANLKDQLVALFLQMGRSQDSTQTITQKMQDFTKAAQQEGEMFYELTARLRGVQQELLGVNPERLREQEQLQVKLTKLRGILEETTVSQEGVNAGLARYKELWDQLKTEERELARVKTLHGEIKKMVTTIEDDLARALVTATETGKLSFSDLFASAGRDLLAYMFKVQLLRPLFQALFGDIYSGGSTGSQGLIGDAVMKMLQFYSGGTSGTGAGAGDIPTTANIGHGGGIMGSAMQTRAVSSSLFNSAPRYHGGRLGAGEMPAILKRGEGVFTEAQMKSLAPAGGAPSVTVNVINQSGEPLKAENSGQPRMDAQGWVVDVLISKMSRDSRLRQNMRSMLAAPT